jgi:hypothetical protein
MAFVTITFDGIERALSEEDARFLGEQLHTRRAPHSVAMKLADRIEQEARGGTFADPGHDVVVDEAERLELLEVTEAIDLDASSPARSVRCRWRFSASAGRESPAIRRKLSRRR